MERENIGNLLSYYEAADMLFNYYESETVANEIDNPEVSVECKKKRQFFYELGKKIMGKIENELTELKL